jgi:cobyrinic acid a,c-diamide synthase
MMVVTRAALAEKLSAYLRRELSLAELVDWAQDVMQEGDFDEADYETLRDIISRLGVADVRAFGLTWEDCEQFLRQLGYTVRVEVVAQR